MMADNVRHPIAVHIDHDGAIQEFEVGIVIEHQVHRLFERAIADAKRREAAGDQVQKAVSIQIRELDALGGKGHRRAFGRGPVSRGVRQIAVLLLPASAPSAVLAEPMVRLLYQRGGVGPDQTTGVAGGLANTVWLGLRARVTEGLAAGVVQPSPAIIILRGFQPDEQGRAMGIFGAGVMDLDSRW